MTSKLFRSKCEAAAEKLGLKLYFYDETKAKIDAFHDDGTLHVQQGKLRACFDVSNNQNDKQSVVNKKTKNVMNELGLPVTGRVLVDEPRRRHFSSDDEDDEDSDS